MSGRFICVDLCTSVLRFPDLDDQEVLDVVAGRAKGRHVEFALLGVPYRNHRETAARWLSAFSGPEGSSLRPVAFLGDAQRALSLQAEALDGYGSELLADEDERWALYRARREFLLRRELETPCPRWMRPMVGRARALLEQAVDLVDEHALEGLRRSARLLDDAVLETLKTR